MAQSCTSTKIELQDTVEWETFEGENFRGFRGLRAIHESFLCEIWGCATTTYDCFKQSVKVFSAKFSLPTDPRKFSPSKVFRYTVTHLRKLNPSKISQVMMSQFTMLCTLADMHRSSPFHETHAQYHVDM